MKIVLDTNVLVSGIFWGGVPLRILKLWDAGKVEVLASDVILDEYLKTINRIALRLDRSDLYDQWSLVIPSKVRLVDVKKSFRLCRDPDDDKFIDCAIAGKARYIVSGDHDLLVLGRVMRAKIVRPRTLIRTLFA